MIRVVVLALTLFAAFCNGESQRIVGGNPTTIEKYPSIVQSERLNNEGIWSQSCGANILNTFYVLSAAHCFHGSTYAPHLRRIRAGTTYRNTGGVVVYITKEYNHPSYMVASRYDGDISVVRLASPLHTSSVIKQAIIPHQGMRFPDNSQVVHVGWGHTIPGQSSASAVLLDTQINIINHEICKNRYGSGPNPQLITKNMICAGLLDIGGRDACQGDSGGPLYYNHIIIGVVSWGRGCANETYPGISAAIAPYTNWILSIATV